MKTPLNSPEPKTPGEPKSPRAGTGGAGPYRKGRVFEWDVIHALTAAGWVCIRAAQSGGVFDIAAFRRGRVLWIQCKRDGKLPPGEWNRLYDLATEHQTLPVLAFRRPVLKEPLFQILSGKKTARKPGPCCPFFP